jgi:hypothetical protein
MGAKAIAVKLWETHSFALFKPHTTGTLYHLNLISASVKMESGGVL